MTHLISCECGKVQGEILIPSKGVRAICYCKDCQEFAAYLGRAEKILDSNGGTEVVGLRQSNIRIRDDEGYIQCVQLKPKGLFRWYAACCNTPIGNTFSNYKVSHIGLIHNFITHLPRTHEEAFGAVKLQVNTSSATAPVIEQKAKIGVIVSYVFSLLRERLCRRYKLSPLFTCSGKPISSIKKLDEQ